MFFLNIHPDNILEEKLDIAVDELGIDRAGFTICTDWYEIVFVAEAQEEFYNSLQKCCTNEYCELVKMIYGTDIKKSLNAIKFLWYHNIKITKKHLKEIENYDTSIERIQTAIKQLKEWIPTKKDLLYKDELLRAEIALIDWETVAGERKILYKDENFRINKKYDYDQKELCFYFNNTQLFTWSDRKTDNIAYKIEEVGNYKLFIFIDQFDAFEIYITKKDEILETISSYERHYTEYYYYLLTKKDNRLYVISTENFVIDLNNDKIIKEKIKINFTLDEIKKIIAEKYDIPEIVINIINN